MNLPDCLPRTALVLSYVYGVENYTLVDKQILFHFEMGTDSFWFKWATTFTIQKIDISIIFWNGMIELTIGAV